MKYTSPRFSLPVTIALLSLASGLNSFGQAAPQARPAAAVRITQPVDASSMVTLKGNVSPLANVRNDVGPMRPDTELGRIQLVLKRGPQQESALRQLVQDMHTPGSPSYHKWLTPAEFGQQFGPSDQDIQTIENWVSSRGFQVEKLSPDKGMLEISGTSGQLDSTFHTAMHRYLLNGQQHYANSTDPQIPTALAPVVGGFVSLNNFPVHRLSRTLGRANYDTHTGQATPEWTNPSGSPLGFDLVVSPKDYAVQYDLNPLYSAGTNGAGQTIAIVNDSNINLNLVNNFRSLFGLAPNPPHVIIDGNDPGIDGVNNVDGPNGDSIEAYLDVEWAGAVAPNATVDLVIGADTAVESGVILAAERAVYSDLAPVLSLSFGACEEVLGSSGNAFINQLWEQAAAEGITVLVASGDSGSAGTDPTGQYCDSPSEAAATFGTGVSGYASTPFNVAVGGTDFYYSSHDAGQSSIVSQLNGAWNTTPTNTPQVSLNAPLPEQPWNDSVFGLNILVANGASIAGGGGGPSTCGLANSITGACAPYPKPTWQTPTNDNARDIPDVSLFAADGLNGSYIPICANDGDCQPGAGTTQVTGVGGTSAAAPSMAGIMALVNQKYGPQGQADYTLYPLAKQYPAAFHDVTVGTNAMPCSLTSSNMAAGDCVAGGTVSGQGELKGYAATNGYDLATGLGSVDANLLVTDWGNIHLTATSTTLTPSSTSFTHGTAVTFNTSVTGSGGTPSGSVALVTDSTSLSQQGQTVFALKSGSGTGSVNYLPGGTYNIWGNYSGDGTFAVSASSKTQITVTPENSSLVLTPVYASSNCQNGYCVISNGANNVPYGTQIILDGAAVPTSQYQCSLQGNCTGNFAPSTGTITFSDNGNVINTAVINVEGDAEFNSGSYALGKHSITASYSGDASYSQSTAAATTFTIVQGTPTVTVTSSVGGGGLGQGTLSAGQTLVLTAVVSGGGIGAAPTGSVKFANGTTIMGTANLVASVDPNTGNTVGIATLKIANASATAKNDSASPFRWLGAGGGAVFACVFLFGLGNGRRKWQKLLSLLVIAFLVTGVGCGGGGSSSGGSGGSGGSGSGGSGSGGSGSGGSGGSGNGMSVIAVYSGDANYATASSAAYTVTVGAASSLLTSTTTATASASATSPASAITISVTVTGQSGHPAPTGNLDFQSSGYDYQTAIPLVPGSGDTSTATLTVNSSILLQGENAITLQYYGDKTYQPSSYNLNISNPLSDFSMVAVTPVLSTSNSTGNITLTSVNGFSGAVALSCTATGGITCSVPASVTVGATPVPVTVNINASGSGTVVVTGTSGGTLSHNVAIAVK